MILVDSSVWIDYFNGIPTWQTDLLDTMEGLTLLHDDRDFDPMVSHFSLKTPTPR